jgi:hypothetical protein
VSAKGHAQDRSGGAVDGAAVPASGDSRWTARGSGCLVMGSRRRPPPAPRRLGQRFRVAHTAWTTLPRCPHRPPPPTTIFFFHWRERERRFHDRGLKAISVVACGVRVKAVSPVRGERKVVVVGLGVSNREAVGQGPVGKSQRDLSKGGGVRSGSRRPRALAISDTRAARGRADGVSPSCPHCPPGPAPGARVPRVASTTRRASRARGRALSRAPSFVEQVSLG